MNDDYITANRAAWNEAGPIHERHTFDEILRRLQQSGSGYLDSVLIGLLNKIGIQNKAVAHLCCNNGRELMSIKNMGAGYCVGFDFSQAFITQARRISSVTGIECEFVECDLAEIPERYNERFDIVLITKGTFGWLPTLARIFEPVANLMRANASLCVYEMHPILDMFWDAEDSNYAEIRHSYFRKNPFVDHSGLDFFSKQAHSTSAAAYWFHHKLSDIIGASMQYGLSLRSFDEYEHDISLLFTKYETFATKVPLSYSFVSRKMPIE